ncbi:MAG: tRNA pseudouridine(38-40) synthase TruA [Firmicutes bacterium]|nr:tRNA pseudouridine(38-40) synthase TruA [Bacillota bacterium]
MMSYSLESIDSILSEDVGLKVDALVVLNKENVSKYILEHSELFSEIFENVNLDFNMNYGFSSLGFPYKVGILNNKINRLVLSRKTTHLQRVQLKIRYDGTDFNGFQIQKNSRSVAGELTKLISKINDCPTVCYGASRTDSGVHAIEQIVHFDTSRDLSVKKWKHYFESELPKDITIEDVKFVHPLFHSRYDVFTKEYRYLLNTAEYDPLRRHFEWTVGKLDENNLEKNLNLLIGTFDFTSFCTGEKNSKIRTIFEASFIKRENTIELVFVGNGFLHHMIRLLVFQLVKMAKQEIQDDILQIINEKSRKHTTKIAPANGLYLTKITYE